MNSPLTMVLIEGSLANVGGVIFSVGLLAVNYKLLPKEFRFSSFEIVISVISIVFYGFFLINVMLLPFGLSF